jgi:phage portal protein BeeE
LQKKYRFRLSKDGKNRVHDQIIPTYNVIAIEPNSFMTSFVFVKQWRFSFLIKGNALAKSILIKQENLSLQILLVGIECDIRIKT